MNIRALSLIPALIALVCCYVHATSPDPFAGVEVTSQPIAGPIHLIRSVGGNIAASVGEDGTLIIDAEFAPLAQRVLAAIKALGGSEPRVIVNTHFHSDHVGGNTQFGRTGTIVAHANVRYRLLETENRIALPIVTFQDQLTLHFNGDQIDIIHLPRGHTDGDVVVWFRKTNVLHMGDQFWNGLFPRIDLEAGGSIDGYAENISAVLEMIRPDTRIVPGHGELGNAIQLVEFQQMIETTRAHVAGRLEAGSSVDEIIANGLGSKWRGWGGGYITEDTWIRTLTTPRKSSNTGSRE